MRFSSALTTTLLASLAGTTLASGISPRRVSPVDLEKRDCDCQCRSHCSDDCSGFNNGSGGGVSWGLCALTCADSCGCNVNKPCTNQDSVKEICDKLKAIPEVDPALSAQISITCLALGYASR